MKQWKILLPALALGLAVGLGVAAAVLGDQLTAPVSGILFGLAGAIGGVSASKLIMAHFDRTWTPEQRREIERAERYLIATPFKSTYSLLFGVF